MRTQGWSRLIPFLAAALIGLPSAPAGAQPTNIYCGPADVAFVVGDTFKMEPTIYDLKASVAQILDALESSCDPQSLPPDYRLALVTFKDAVEVRVNFSPNNRVEFEEQLGLLVAAGGGNGLGHASDEALNTVINRLPAREGQTTSFTELFRDTVNGNVAVRRLIVLLTDSMPGGFDGYNPLQDDVTNAYLRAEEARAKGIKILSILPPTNSSTGVAAVMQNYATRTGGWFSRTDEPSPPFSVQNPKPASSLIVWYFSDQASSFYGGCRPVNRPPLASCGSALEPATPPVCSAVPASIDNFSWDPEDRPLTLVQQPPGPYPVGVTNVTLTVTDAENASASCSAEVTVICDAKPIVTVPGPITTEATSASGAIVTFETSATDFSGLVPLPPPVCTSVSGSTFPIGFTFVNCVARDDYGNEGAAWFTVTVHDTTPPDLTVPVSVAAETTTPAGVIVTYGTAATDLVDGPVVPVCTPASGALFAVGATVVSCTATDLHTNRATKTFTVTVTLVDTTAPVVTVPGPITAEATGPTGAPVSFTASAFDNLDGPLTPICVPAAGGTFPLGATTITCTATDAHHNAGTGSFTVTVQDTRPPILTLPLPLTVETQDPAGALVTYAAPKADDVVDPAPTVVCAPASGSRFTVGTTPVSCTARDAAGNAASGAFTVTVNLTTAPVLYGRMFGAGRIDDDRTRHRFVFRVTERNNKEYGRLEFWSIDSRDDDDDDDAGDGDRDRDYGRNHRHVKTTFVSTSIKSVAFSDDPAFTPGRSRRQPTVDSVVFAGAGKWRGKAGYTFEVSATDGGEPGRLRDSFSLVVKDAGGVVVANVSGKIEGGNIQSTRLSR